MKRRTFTHLVCTCLVLLLCTTDIYGQLDVQQLTEQQGLGNNTVNAIHQDRKGFLWIGTDIGITRYGGNFFHVYNLSRTGGGEPISVSDIQETQDRYLWLQCKGNIVACFDKLQDKYLPIQWNDGIGQEDILKLYSTGNTLYAILPDGLYMLNAESDGKIVRLHKKTVLHGKRLNTAMCSRGDVIYLTDKDNRLIILDTRNGKSNTVDCGGWGIDTHRIHTLHVQNGHLFVCGDFEGILCYHLEEDALRTILIPGNKADYKHPNIREICYLKDNRFAISNKRFIYEMKFDGEDYLRDRVEIIRRVQYERQFEQLIRNRINRLHYDTDNHVLWIGTYGNGLVRQNVSHTYAFQIKLPENVYHINDIVQDAQGYIWLGTRKNGVLKSTDTELSDQTRFENWKHADADGSYHLQKDRNGFIWIGSEHGTIQKLNPNTQELVDILPPDSITDVIKDLSIRNLYMNSRNRLWVATANNVAVYDENTSRWLVFKNYLKPYGKVTCIVEDAEGVMWLGTEHGVFEANVPLDIPNKIDMKGGFEKEVGLTDGEVLSMHVTNTNQILVSYQDKIVRMEKNKIINHIVLQEDIPYGHITCMVDDRNGNTWAGSNESLISIHNKTNTYFSFPFSGNEPTVCRLNNSTLLWGNMPELVFFDPIKLKELPRKKVYITDIEVNARKMTLPGQAIYNAGEVELTQGDHARFLFSKLNYNAVQNKTAYRILPTDTLWKENSHNEIVVDRLEAGTYTLEIKPVYPTPGGEETTSLKLVVRHHWAFSPMALLGYTVIVIAGSVFVQRFLRRRRRRRQFYREQYQELKNTLEETKLTGEQEKRKQELRNSILASIATELKTPLSIISNSLKEQEGNKSLDANMQQRFKLAYRNTLYIQEACEQFMNINKMGVVSKQLKVSACPVYRITDAAIRASREIISSCPIQIDYGQTKVMTELWVDYPKVEFVVKNMLSNAFRRIHYDGVVRCSIYTEDRDGQECCVFRIIDDAKRPDAVIQESLTVGMSLMEDIAQRHHGSFKVISKPGEGTETLLYIPLGKQHFENDADVYMLDNAPLQETTGEEPLLLSSEEQPLTEEVSPAKPSANKPNVVVVEEHKDTRLYLKLQLEGDYTVHLAKNGKEGMETVRKVLPDLVISEAKLPVVDGFELTRSLKEDMDTCHIPVILVSILVNNEDIIKGMEMGADEYIRKPFDIEVLKSKVKRLIKNRVELKRNYTKLLIPAGDKTGEGTADADKDNMEDPLVKKVIQLVNDNIQNEDFSVKKLAEMLNMSQPTLYRKIKQLTNFTLIEVVRGVRLKRAAELLKSKKCNVQEAAEAVGYNDIPTFRKHFVDLYGITPSAFSKEENNEKK